MEAIPCELSLTQKQVFSGGRPPDGDQSQSNNNMGQTSGSSSSRWLNPARRLLPGPHSTWVEIFVRLLLFVMYWLTDNADPLIHRKIHPEELWLYKNPVTPSYIPSQVLWVIAVAVPIIIISAVFAYRQDQTDTVQALLGVSLSALLTILLTNSVKLIACRPRPDFYYRCFPDGVLVKDMACTGQEDHIRDGYKSFPSGHSSFAFASLGYMSWYLVGKLHIFTSIGRGQAWRMLIAATPSFGALLIALSRTADYHHHWQDVLVGSLIGLGISYFCYRQYFPSFCHPMAHQPYVSISPTSNHLQGAADKDQPHSPSSPQQLEDKAAAEAFIKLV